MDAQVPASVNVIVVDSDQVCRGEVCALLQSVGYGVAPFGTAEAVLAAIEVIERSSCVVSEMDLPGMTGLELSDRLRALDKALPVIILTRDSNVATAVTAMRSNIADYLVKPFIERELIHRLRNVVAGHSARMN